MHSTNATFKNCEFRNNIGNIGGVGNINSQTYLQIKSSYFY